MKQDFIYPVWTLTLDPNYMCFKNMESNNLDSYVVTKYSLENKYFCVKLMDKDRKHMYKFRIPNPLESEEIVGLAEVGKYKVKKCVFRKSKILVDLRFLSMTRLN